MLKELLEKYFDENLTEDAKVEIETMFEAAIKEATKKRVAEKEQALEEKYAGELKQFKSELVDNLSAYLESAFGEWFEANKPAEIAGVKVAMAEKVMGKLRGALSEVFVEIKEEDVNVVNDLEGQLTEAKTAADKAGNDAIEAQRQSFEYQKAIAFMKMTEGMTLTDKEALLDLVEDIEAADIDTFTKKAGILKEKLAGKGAGKKKGAGLKEGKELEDPEKELTEGMDEVDKYLPKGFN